MWVKEKDRITAGVGEVHIDCLAGAHGPMGRKWVCGAVLSLWVRTLSSKLRELVPINVRFGKASVRDLMTLLLALGKLFIAKWFAYAGDK